MLQNGVNAASLAVAEQYVQAFSKLAKNSNTILLPEKTGDISSMVAQVGPMGCGWRCGQSVTLPVGCSCIW